MLDGIQMSPDQNHSRKWLFVLIGGVACFAGLLLVVYWRYRNIDERTRAWLIDELNQRFESRAELEDLHVHLWPKMGVDGRNLSLYYRDRPNVSPLIHIEEFSFNLGIMGIVHLPRQIHSVHLQNMTITILPSQKNGAVKTRPFLKPPIIVRQIVCDQTHLIMVPKNPEKEPLDFDIHNLLLNDVGFDKPFDFHATLTNAKPK